MGVARGASGGDGVLREAAGEGAHEPEAACEAAREPEACVAAAELYFDGGINQPGPHAGRWGIRSITRARPAKARQIARRRASRSGRTVRRFVTGRRG